MLDADCSSEPKLCKKLGQSAGVIYYSLGKVDKKSGTVSLLFDSSMILLQKILPFSFILGCDILSRDAVC